MSVVKSIIGLSLSAIFSSSFAAEKNCDLIRIDAGYGAESQRAGDTEKQALDKFEKSIAETDSRLKNSQKKPYGKDWKLAARKAFVSGFDRARTSKDTVEQLAGQFYLECTFEKMK